MTDREWAGPLSSDTEYCYCKEDRCNSQKQVTVAGFMIVADNIINPQGGNLIADEASNGTDSTSTVASSQTHLAPDSLHHPRNTHLFYKMTRSGSQDLEPMVVLLLISCVLAKLLP